MKAVVICHRLRCNNRFVLKHRNVTAKMQLMTSSSTLKLTVQKPAHLCRSWILINPFCKSILTFKALRDHLAFKKYTVIYQMTISDLRADTIWKWGPQYYTGELYFCHWHKDIFASWFQEQVDPLIPQWAELRLVPTGAFLEFYQVIWLEWKILWNFIFVHIIMHTGKRTGGNF